MTNPFLYDYIRSRYNYKDGKLINRDNYSVLGSLAPSGKFLRTTFSSPRVEGHYTIDKLVWLFHTNEYPESLVHVDGNPLNNDIRNLRVLVPSDTKFKGVIMKYSGWYARKRIRGVRVDKGPFWTAVQAHDVYKNWAES